LISTIEEARRETQEEFYRVHEERSQKEWETKKKRVFEELGTRIGGPGGDRTVIEMRASHAKGGLVVSPFLDFGNP
jgi:nuclear pore complex protein Nup93